MKAVLLFLVLVSFASVYGQIISVGGTCNCPTYCNDYGPVAWDNIALNNNAVLYGLVTSNTYVNVTGSFQVYIQFVYYQTTIPYTVGNTYSIGNQLSAGNCSIAYIAAGAYIFALNKNNRTTTCLIKATGSLPTSSSSYFTDIQLGRGVMTPNIDCSAACPTNKIKWSLGSDGISYPNLCSLQTSVYNGNCGVAGVHIWLPNPGTTVSYAGWGCQSTVCTPTVPICGTDLYTYYNGSCQIGAYGCPQNPAVYIAPRSPGPCVCTAAALCGALSQNDGPICGTDGNNYLSTCNLYVTACNNTARVTVASSGCCPGNCAGTTLYGTAGLCGSDGNWYMNYCYLNSALCLGTAVPATTIPSPPSCPVGAGICSGPCS